MSLILRQRMTRLEDGVEGVVEVQGGELRVIYSDRGELRVAGKQEKWIPADIGSMKLRPEEMLEVAIEADRTLRAIDRHEPRRYWEPIKAGDFHDPGLIETIVAYLRKRA